MVLSKLVILLSEIGIAEDLICFSDSLEFLVRSVVTRVFIYNVQLGPVFEIMRGADQGVL